ncbi:ShlB/FhaC/HecB family hemolysin secretion/activation protein [Roseomonas sp. CCTCC AB2023176]|uniref:ShlB/FhaC/HecB family hemolysin secretion/activation protein n=1 Tax=Roseomonas sp. CCTCC AB2023176 TaxID=3342640 RepID=UPI0035D9768A
MPATRWRAAGAASALLFLAPPALAQFRPPTLPQAIERLAPSEQPRLSPSAVPDAPEARRGPGEDRVIGLRRVELTDATVLTPAALGGTLAGLEGRDVPLRQVEEARVAILSAFRQAGYPFVAVNATLAPAGDGRFDLRFAVVEAQVTEIRLDGDIGPAATQALRFAEPLRRLGPLQADALERALLLISDIPGVTVRGILQPVEGQAGALRLVLRLDRQAFSGLVTLDNRAFRLTGPWQALAVLQGNSFTEFGERTEVSLYGTEEFSQRFAQVASEWFVGGSGLRIRLQAGYGESEPRGFLEALGYTGTSTIAGITASYPIIRSRPANLTATAGFDYFEGRVEADRNGANIDALDRVFALRGGLTGNLLDPGPVGPLPPGATQAQIRLSQGLGGNTARPSRAGADGGFFKVTGEVVRNQPIAELAPGLGLTLQLLLAGQWSPDVLPFSEKFLLGGGRITRGYYAGQASGDIGWAGGVELQLEQGFDLPPLVGLPAMRMQAQAYLFHDRGRAIQNAALERDVSLSSFGGGIRLFFERAVQIEAEVARRLERRPDGAAAPRVSPVMGFLGVVVRF